MKLYSTEEQHRVCIDNVEGKDPIQSTVIVQLNTWTRPNQRSKRHERKQHIQTSTPAGYGLKCEAEKRNKDKERLNWKSKIIPAKTLQTLWLVRPAKCYNF